MEGSLKRYVRIQHHDRTPSPLCWTSSTPTTAGGGGEGGEAADCECMLLPLLVSEVTREMHLRILLGTVGWQPLEA